MAADTVVLLLLVDVAVLTSVADGGTGAWADMRPRGKCGGGGVGSTSEHGVVMLVVLLKVVLVVSNVPPAPPPWPLPPPPPPLLVLVGGQADEEASNRLVNWLLNSKEGEGGDPSEEASMDAGGEDREGGMNDRWLLLEVACRWWSTRLLLHEGPPPPLGSGASNGSNDGG